MEKSIKASYGIAALAGLGILLGFTLLLAGWPSAADSGTVAAEGLRIQETAWSSVGAVRPDDRHVAMAEVIAANTAAHRQLQQSVAEFQRQLHQSPPRIKRHMLDEHMPESLVYIGKDGGLDAVLERGALSQLAAVYFDE